MFVVKDVLRMEMVTSNDVIQFTGRTFNNLKASFTLLRQLNWNRNQTTLNIHVATQFKRDIYFLLIGYSYRKLGYKKQQ